MATDHCIPPFPSDVDRVAFGHWLSGFTDGEGCFGLHATPNRPAGHDLYAFFRIGLRVDDVDTLRSIQSYLQCGTIRIQPSTSGSAVARFSVDSVHCNHKIIATHFESFPLQSKKRHDFAIWKRAVAIAFEVRRRPIQSPGGRRISKWSEEEILQFIALAAALRESRKYKS